MITLTMAGRTSYTAKKRGKVILRATVSTTEGETTEEHFRRLGEEIRSQKSTYEAITKRPGQGFRRKRPDPET